MRKGRAPEIIPLSCFPVSFVNCPPRCVPIVFFSSWFLSARVGGRPDSPRYRRWPEILIKQHDGIVVSSASLMLRAVLCIEMFESGGGGGHKISVLRGTTSIMQLQICLRTGNERKFISPSSIYTTALMYRSRYWGYTVGVATRSSHLDGGRTTSSPRIETEEHDSLRAVDSYPANK